MNLYFDNIIFSLQKAGGVSVVWYELLRRAINDNEINAFFISSKSDNIFGNRLTIHNDAIIDDHLSLYPTQIQRYLNPKISGIKGIFHSSYYRTVREPNIQNVTTVHDFTYEYYRKGLPKHVHFFQKSNAIKNSDHIICVSENTKKDLLRFIPKIEESKISVIYNGVDSSYYQFTSSNLIKSSKVPFNCGEYLIYIGDRKSDYKNFTLAVNVCKNTKIPLVIVGGGALNQNEVIFLDSEMGAINYVHLSGIDNKELNILYNNALCLLYPSLYEGFGIPVLEAQKAGCPVIATKSSSIPEIIGSVSTLVEKPEISMISHIIKQLKNDSNFRLQQINIGLNNSSRFSWDKCYEETKEVYKKLNQKMN